VSAACYSCLLVLVAMLPGLSVSPDGGETAAGPPRPLCDPELSAACGPVACYLAVEAIGINADLDDMLNRVGWVPGRATSMKSIADCLAATPGVRCLVLRPRVHELASMIMSNDCSAVVPVRDDSGSVDHVLTITGFRSQRFIAVDYPRGALYLSERELAGQWEGTAVLAFNRRQANLKTANLFCCYLNCCMMTYLLCAWAGGSRLRRRIVAPLRVAAGSLRSLAGWVKRGG
jgi:hypothetical protein